jgi:serine/threonine protein kinase
VSEQPIVLNDRYLLEERQGSGGMAMVYRARDLMLERQVAIKILRKSYSANPEFRERFRLEAKAAANLSHPNIATIHDFGLDADRLFFVMEFVPGTDLKTLIKQRGHLPLEEAIQLMSQACAGIGYAHRAGLVHCDVKPQNMLITPDNRLKVVDFGIARALSTIKEDEQVDIVWGSPQYFSPEQAAGIAPSPASDVYSLGIVLYEMLTGQLPFIAATADDLARLHRETLPPSPRNLNPEIPIQLEKIILKVLSKDPSGRYRTADQLGRVLVSLHTHRVQGNLALPESATKGVAPAVDPPGPQQTNPSQQLQPRVPSPAHSHTALPRKRSHSDLNPITDFDWVTWMLALLTLIAAGGLIPFWLWVIYSINNPI